MAETRTIRFQEPGTTKFHTIVLNESSRTQITNTDRVAEIIKAVILDFGDGLAAADAATAASNAATKMASDGDI